MLDEDIIRVILTFSNSYLEEVIDANILDKWTKFYLKAKYFDKISLELENMNRKIEMSFIFQNKMKDIDISIFSN
jgi:hypothetical protein